jgi:hypothetical protein
MRKFRVFLYAALWIASQTVGLAQQADNEKKAAAQTITATGDANGSQHPGTAAIRGPSSIKCVSAIGQGHQQKPSCYITAPGYSGIVDIGKTVGASGAGTVTLTCNGQGALRCTAQITP